jgi:hypothetical protein
MTFTAKLREMSNNLKASKEGLAAVAVGKAITVVTDVLETYAVAAEYVVEATNTCIAVARVAKDNEKAREQLQTLVAHTIGDLASRLNEVANFVELVSKDQTVQEKCASTMNLYKALEERAQKHEALVEELTAEDEGTVN